MGTSLGTGCTPPLPDNLEALLLRSLAPVHPGGGHAADCTEQGAAAYEVDEPRRPDSGEASLLQYASRSVVAGRPIVPDGWAESTDVSCAAAGHRGDSR